MPGLWIDEAIMSMKCTPAEKLLLARICFRASGQQGQCTDSNRALGQATDLHPQSVSDMVKKLAKNGLLIVAIDPSRANLRTLTPGSHLLTGYKSNAYSDYKSNPHAISQTLIADYKETPDSTISQKLIPYKELTDSIYKDIKTKENKEKISIDDAGEKIDDFLEKKRGEKAPPPTPPPALSELPPPEPTFTDRLLANRDFVKSVGKNLNYPAEQLPGLIDTFTTELIALDKKHTGYRDFQQHAYHWLKIQSEKQQRHAAPNAKPLPAASAAPGSVIRRTYSHQPAKPTGRTPAD